VRTEFAALLASLALCACASAARPAAPASPVAPVHNVAACVLPGGPVVRADFCGYPADVRAFLEDRDACDHFRGEPWPESDSDADRERRRQLIDGVRTGCAGTDARLAALKARYAGDPPVVALLSTFDADIEP
jgi:hypothetical protein